MAANVARIVPLVSGKTVIDRTAQFLREYIALPDQTLVVISAWVAAAHLFDSWDRFPHLAITSPEKRCGKTTLLNLLSYVVPRPLSTSSISPAALYFAISSKRPTLLFDEAQSLSRTTSEAGNALREILNASIEKRSCIYRRGGAKMDKLVAYKIYSPKVFAMIGEPDSVLADRCLTVSMVRKTDADIVSRSLSRTVQPRGKAIHDELEEWAAENAENASILYDVEEPFDISNDRKAELLLPLQTTLRVAGCDDALDALQQYAESLEEKDEHRQSPGVRMLAGCREIFDATGETFIATVSLVASLIELDEEPWKRWNHNNGLTNESLAYLLRPFNIRSQKQKGTKQTRGYYRADFEEAWGRYLSNPPATRLGPARR